jgi:protein-S-isoprenylcysteine O-methyltransferase Ste14
MAYILTGSSAFVLIAIYDWAKMRKYTWLKLLIPLSTFALLLGILGVLSGPVEFEFVLGIRTIAWIGLAIFLLLLMYSILIEIPIKIKHSGYEPGGDWVLVDTGTYALSRHPGVLWFGGAAICMIVLHPAMLTLSAGIVWTTLDVLLVWAEDQLFFPNTFPGYAEYKTRTPFLIPNLSSLHQCLATWKIDT